MESTFRCTTLLQIFENSYKLSSTAIKADENYYYYCRSYERLRYNITPRYLPDHRISGFPYELYNNRSFTF